MNMRLVAVMVVIDVGGVKSFAPGQTSARAGVVPGSPISEVTIEFTVQNWSLVELLAF